MRLRRLRMTCVGCMILLVACVASAADRPESRTILFTRRNVGLMLMDEDGGNVRILKDKMRVPQGDWAPDGTSVVFSDSGAVFLTIMEYPDGPSRQLSLPPGARFPRIPRWSPDGLSIVFEAWAGAGNADVYITDVADGDGHNVTSHRRVDEYPTWSSDARRIAFHSDRDPAFWAPAVGAEDIYVADVDGENVRNVTQTQERELWPHWSPDGHHIAFTRTSGALTTNELWILNLETGGQRRIADIPPVWTATWTPSGRRLLLTVFQDDPSRTDIAIVDADGSNFRRLTDTPVIDAHPRMFDPDALVVAPASKAATTWGHVKALAEGGPVE